MWLSTADAPQGEVVMTKIDDENGCRNEQALRLRGNLWYSPDDEMYVYYRPTHYRALTADERQAEIAKVQKKADQFAALAASI